MCVGGGGGGGGGGYVREATSSSLSDTTRHGNYLDIINFQHAATFPLW